MEFSLSSQDKVRISKMAKHKLELELFEAAINAGINPESLTLVNEVFTWQPESDANEYSASVQLRLREILNVYEQFLLYEKFLQL
jgi:hypothetical protein